MKARLASVPVLGWILRVQERFGEVRGTALANGLALQAFLSLFPLLILGVSVVGFLAEGDVRFADDVVDGLGVAPEDDLADDIHTAIDNARDSRGATGVVGLVSLFWTGLGVVAALQRIVDSTWQSAGQGLKDKARAALVVLGAGLILAGSIGLSSLINVLPGAFAPLSILLGLSINLALFLWLFVALGRLPIGWRPRLPGAVACGVGLEVLKLIGTVYVPRLVANSSALYGSLGIVVAILLWLVFFGRLIVYGSVINVLHWEDVHGSVEVPIDAPRVDGSIPLAANRSGAIVDRLTQ